MDAGEDRALWMARLRWRLRGAWQGPAFALGTVLDAVLLARLPIAGDRGPGAVAAVLLATFFNLIVAAALAPVAGALVRRRSGLPAIVARDRAGTVLIAATTLLLLAMGLAHRPAVRAASADFATQAALARRVVLRRAPVQFRRNVDRMDTWKQGPGLYRTCAPGPDSRRAFCVIVMTDSSPPTASVDPDQEPNARLHGPDNPGRQDG
jgi:hypothetical protein